MDHAWFFQVLLLLKGRGGNSLNLICDWVECIVGGTLDTQPPTREARRNLKSMVEEVQENAQQLASFPDRWSALMESMPSLELLGSDRSQTVFLRSAAAADLGHRNWEVLHLWSRPQVYRSP